ncbi:hypothetical protein [Sorangium cellulosum]|uniref:Uncharacterized protein n=1 Tax=Sorangium cellulosum So0157-2 TaxID=1254432 RepID=S4Y9X8_SORCE|nr:hypothetical protein [Sorangium cellulosum]AGP39593.1 hypothetical protein SCE1572_36945 [Sorangium cellulosum So0157-2]
MPRRPTGSRFRNDAGRLYVRVLVGDKDRESFPLDPKQTAEQAERHGSALHTGSTHHAAQIHVAVSRCRT